MTLLYRVQMALEPTRLPIRWILYAISSGVKRRGGEVTLTLQLHLMRSLRMEELYLHSLIRLHDVVLNYNSIDTNLKFYPLFSSSIVESATQHNSMQCSISTIDNIVFEHPVPLMYHSLILFRL
jgi:hypothetical protein